MATAWQSLEEAALTLGISSRTLHRRIVKGEFESRLENGRREVLISIEEASLPIESNLSDVLSDASATPEPDTDLQSEATDESMAHPMADMSDDVGSTMLALHEDRIRRTDLAIMAYQQSVNVTASQVRRTHRQAKIAWSIAACLAVGTFAAAIWATHSVTKADAEVSHLNSLVRQLSDTSDSKSRDVEKLRNESETAKIATARAQGQLDAAQGRIDQLKEEKEEQVALQSKVAMQATPILAASITAPTTQAATTQPVQPLTTAR